VRKINYASAIREGFEFLLANYDEFFVIGQGLWSPWYVGETMKDLDKKFGVERVIDTPVSENACTGAGVGASIAGLKTVVVHPRMDFMLYAIDPIVNQAAKWSSMFGSQTSAGVTIRSIINRGGQQGAQHSQAFHPWFSNVPGLRVIMPYSVKDARDLLISSALSNDPVIFIDDRWLYDTEDNLGDVEILDLSKQKPNLLKKGNDVTIVGSGYSTFLGNAIHEKLLLDNITAEIIDMRVLNPIDTDLISNSVSKTKNLVVIDGGWEQCGIGAEIIAQILENKTSKNVDFNFKRFSTQFAPAPSSQILENEFYPKIDEIIKYIRVSIEK
tara:strand:+ start:153 stop:1136 length:984 start_codon:yes stop_codon:yes gene_type:complete